MIADKRDYASLAERRLMYIKTANAEKVKLNNGGYVNRELLAACNAVIESLQQAFQNGKE